MNRKFKAAVSLFAAMVTLLSSVEVISTSAVNNISNTVVTQNDTFTVVKDEKGYRFLGPTGDDTVDLVDAKHISELYANKDNTDSPKRDKFILAQVGNSSLPSSVDLSATKYFPAIGNQGGLGSCTSWSTAYYQFSYEMNKQRNTQATPENTASPKFVYSAVNNADNDKGTVAEDNYRLLKYVGAPSIAELPYDEVYLDWNASGDLWKKAMNWRLKDYYFLDDVGNSEHEVSSPDDEDLQQIKQTLADGKVISYSTFISSWVSEKIVAHPDAPENSKYVDEYIVKYQDGYEGPHRMTLVGYNDNLWVDQNSNSKVDKGEMGAFKIANSWGVEYANKGFCWVSYDALNKVSSVEGGYAGNRQPIFSILSCASVEPYKKGSDIYLKLNLNTADRSQMKINITAERNGEVENHLFFYGVPYRSERNTYSFAGTKEASDGNLYYPLDNVASDVNAANFEEYKWDISLEDLKEDGKSLLIKNIEIVNENTGLSYAVDIDAPVGMDGKSLSYTVKDAKTNDKSVYYIGYDKPVIHYRTYGGVWHEAEMEYSLNQYGYNYRYIIKDTPDDVELYFTDESGNTDDNSSKYFKCTDRLSFYSTKDACEPLTINGYSFQNGLPDLNKRTWFEPHTTGGYEPYNYQYTLENLDTGAVYTYAFDYQYDKSHGFYVLGNYKLTIEVMDQSKNIASYTDYFEVWDRPFVFCELSVSSGDTANNFVGKSVKFYAETDFERIMSYGNVHSKYEFIVKDSEGNICYFETKRSDTYNLNNCKSIITLDWIPPKSGDYTVTVSSTDGSKQYAEIETLFSVIDKIYGDSNGDGAVDIKDATFIQKYLAGVGDTTAFCEEMADCDVNSIISIKDATCIRKHLAQLSGKGETGNIIEYIPPVTEPETTVPVIETTVATDPVIVEKNMVTFTNSHKWGGTIYCYYWSDSNQSMTSWPGAIMTNKGANGYGETLYTFEVPEGASYIIFSNGSTQTVDIPYSGGEAKFYPLTETDSSGHYKVANW